MPNSPEKFDGTSQVICALFCESDLSIGADVEGHSADESDNRSYSASLKDDQQVI
jgi:hypothetical protein